MNMSNQTNIYEHVIADRQGPPPLVINVVTRPKAMEFVGGVPETSTKMESYVLFSALPEELRARVKTAVEALQAGM